MPDEPAVRLPDTTLGAAEPVAATPLASPTEEGPEARLLSDRVAQHLLECSTVGDELRLRVRPQGLREVARLLIEEPGLRYDYPADLAARDTGAEIELWYRLYSMSRNRSALVRVALDRDEPVVSTLSDIWPGFNWFERECYDLYGVEFIGHPNSGDPTRMRILLPKDWEGFPFRKDYEPVFTGDPLHGPQEPN